MGDRKGADNPQGILLRHTTQPSVNRGRNSKHIIQPIVAHLEEHAGRLITHDELLNALCPRPSYSPKCSKLRRQAPPCARGRR
jgi:hypothetical protein